MSPANAQQTPLFDDIPAGATIASIKPSARNPDRCSIRVGRKAVATIDQRHLAELGIAPGDPWTSELARRVHAASQFDKARKYCINTLTRRGLSRAALIGRLKRKGYDEPVCERVADDLQRIGLLDEQAYAESVARSIVRARPAGRRLIEAKLRQRGVAPETIERAASEVLEPRDQRADALALARKRLASMPDSLDERAKSRRLYALLARRGFPPEVCSECVREALASADPLD